ncbi:PREDICTED: 39S ribosomal protein L40, mitochondrial isoform X2 [Ceratosolen solmsi marchali]|nr:PREDICTED: 39S ribosomal protein L40, mitochondrial isoform X2 [Ceratosolen solmsi marchali]
MAINSIFTPFRSISVDAPLYLNLTNTLCAEPLKKKKKIDPAVIKHREERKKRKLEKFIRRLEKHAEMLKPIHEIEVSKELEKEAHYRRRCGLRLSFKTLEKRAFMFKEWNRYKSAQHREHAKLIRLYMSAKLKALNKLKEISYSLYLDAIKIDDELLPFSSKGPLNTLPIEGYKAPQGDYVDVTRKFD